LHLRFFAQFQCVGVLEKLSRDEQAMNALLPRVNAADLQPGGTGIRAKLHGPEHTFADFLIARDTVNPRVIQAAGIDSPGLTSCLSIGERVAEIWKA